MNNKIQVILLFLPSIKYRCWNLILFHCFTYNNLCVYELHGEVPSAASLATDRQCARARRKSGIDHVLHL